MTKPRFVDNTIVSNLLQGGEFNKELVSALHERAQLEATYARGLSKLSSKLFKATKESTEPPAGIPNTVSNAWHFVAEDMEATADTHRHIASVLDEELVKPLKVFADCQHKTRKSLEAAVDKRVKSLNEWRTSEGKTIKLVVQNLVNAKIEMPYDLMPNFSTIPLV